MRLLAGMRSDVSCLMLETVECLVAQGALVWAREVLSVFPVLTSHHVWLHHNGGHLFFVLSLLLGVDLGQFPPCRLLISLEGGLRVQ